MVVAEVKVEDTINEMVIEPSPRQAAGNVLPVTAVLRSTERMKVYFQFARFRGSYGE